MSASADRVPAVSSRAQTNRPVRPAAQAQGVYLLVVIEVRLSAEA